ncbi:MAG: peptide chain release factor-like protein, partial [Gammaproteobacteria bacterium]
MIRVTDQLAIRAQDLSWRFVRAPGPGGQKVNKVATAVELRFDTHSPVVPEPVRLRLRTLAGRRIGKDGMLLIEACRH